MQNSQFVQRLANDASKKVICYIQMTWSVILGLSKWQEHVYTGNGHCTADHSVMSTSAWQWSSRRLISWEAFLPSLSAVLLLTSVEPLLIQDPSSACETLSSSAESFSTLRLVISLGVKWRGNAGSAQHAALTLEVSHPLLEGGKMAWLNTKNFSRAISWDRCENLVLELVLWPATVVILWRLFVHRFFVLVAPLNCICIANETDHTLHSVPSAAFNSRDASEMFLSRVPCMKPF